MKNQFYINKGKDQFYISDTHFGHEAMCKIVNEDGTKLRPWDNVEDMNEAMIEAWNSVVKPHDKVYHLGDVVINKKYLNVLSRLNGDLVLVKGNHDIFQLKEYTPYFRDIRAYCVVDRIIFSHIPVHPDSKSRFRGNVHGHLHSNSMNDRWYKCVSVEQINYTPISIDEIHQYYHSIRSQV